MTKMERILIVIDHLEKRGLNSERVNSVYRKIVNNDTNNSSFKKT